MPTGDPACKTNLFRWLSLAVDELNKDPAAIVHCWEETQLLRASPHSRPPTSWDKSRAALYLQKTHGRFGRFWPLRAESRRSLALRQ